MPKTTAHFDYLAEATEDKIGFAWKAGQMKAIAVAQCVDQAPDDHFGRCVLGTDLPHVLGAALRSELVRHTAKSSGRSAMSFNRLPPIMMSRASSESDKPSSLTAPCNSGRAKW